MIEKYKTTKELVKLFLQKIEKRAKLNQNKSWKQIHKHEPRL